MLEVAILTSKAGQNGGIWHKTTDDPVAFFTAVLSAITLLLACASIVQTIILARTDKTARMSAESVQLSAEAAIALELPRIEIERIELGQIGAADLRAKLQFPKIRVNVRNSGRTRASLRQEALEVVVSSSLGKSRDHPHAVDVPIGMEIDQGQVYTIENPVKNHILQISDVDDII